MYRPLPEFLTIKNSTIEGLGLWTTKLIKAGTNLGITHIRDDRFENGYSRTPLGGFFNHSKNSNCKVITNGDFIELVTLFDIPENTEITAEYTLYNPEVIG